jgi:hypothetical protein
MLSRACWKHRGAPQDRLGASRADKKGYDSNSDHRNTEGLIPNTTDETAIRHRFPQMERTPDEVGLIARWSKPCLLWRESMFCHDFLLEVRPGPFQRSARIRCLSLGWLFVEDEVHRHPADSNLPTIQMGCVV